MLRIIILVCSICTLGIEAYTSHELSLHQLCNELHRDGCSEEIERAFTTLLQDMLGHQYICDATGAAEPPYYTRLFSREQVEACLEVRLTYLSDALGRTQGIDIEKLSRLGIEQTPHIVVELDIPTLQQQRYNAPFTINHELSHVRQKLNGVAIAYHHNNNSNPDPICDTALLLDPSNTHFWARRLQQEINFCQSQFFDVSHYNSCNLAAWERQIRTRQALPYDTQYTSINLSEIDADLGAYRFTSIDALRELINILADALPYQLFDTHRMHLLKEGYATSSFLFIHWIQSHKHI